MNQQNPFLDPFLAAEVAYRRDRLAADWSHKPVWTRLGRRRRDKSAHAGRPNLAGGRMPVTVPSAPGQA